MKFSILTPSYNTGKYIERAIKSVLAQSYLDWEHIVMDGASTDNTIEILKKYPHLIWESEPDKGQSDAMNQAFKKSTGDIIIYLNADDEFASDALINFKASFDANPQCDMVVAKLEVNNAGCKSINTPSINLRQILNYWPCVFPANSVSYAYKPTLQREVGIFPTNNHYSMDYWFLLRAFLKGKVVASDFVSGTFNFDGSNKSSNAENARKWLRVVRNQFLYRYFYHPDVSKYIVRKYLLVFS